MIIRILAVSSLLLTSWLCVCLAVTPNEDKDSSRVHVTCTPNEMTVSIRPDARQREETEKEDTIVYLEKLRDYPLCQPVFDPESRSYSLRLPLDEDSFFSCGTTRLKNKITGTKVFYHKLVIEQRIRPFLVPQNQTSESDASLFASDSHSDSSNNNHHLDDKKSSETNDEWDQEVVTIRCVISGETSLHPRLRRQTIEEPDLPANFSESSEELLDFSGSVEGRAPMPLLNIAVKQKGEFVDTALNVSPGTPLEMVIYLDDVSARVYGLLTSFLRVTSDNKNRRQEEIIVLNGCSIDPYIFANFESQDNGKSLSAKFRAFKFPDSSFVLFVGTVNVCLDSCQAVACGEGQFGYGRRRRSSSAYDPLPVDVNKVFEAELTAFIRVGEMDVKSKNSVLMSSASSDPVVDEDEDSSSSRSSSGAKVSPRHDLTSTHPLRLSHESNSRSVLSPASVLLLFLVTLTTTASHLRLT